MFSRSRHRHWFQNEAQLAGQERLMGDDFLRTLNALEHAFWEADQTVPLNFVLAARVEGPLTLDILRAALNRQIIRFPILGWSLQAQNDSKVELVDSLNPPRVDVVTGGGWQGQLSRELNIPFDCPNEPICRLKWVRDTTTSHIIMTFHHAVMDGRSGLRVLQCLLEDASAYLAGASLGALREQIPLWSGAIDASPRPSQLRYGKDVLRWPLGDKPLNQRRMGAAPMSFSQDESYAIIHRAQLYGVSITAMFGAAHLLALSDTFERAGLFSLSLPVDWRGRVDGVPLDAFGLLVGEGRVVYRIDPQDDLWSLARRMTGDIKRLAPSAAPHHALNSADVGSESVYERRASTAISNLGRIESMNIHSPLHVHEMHLAVSCGVFGDQIITILSHNGCINALLCVAVPSVAPKAAEKLAHLTRQRLFDACRPSPE